MRQSNCPGELKILVADMITAHEHYVNAHDSLFQATSADEIFNRSRDTVEYYLENRSIWEELHHYKKTGAILGKHSIFAWMNRRDHLRGMSVGDLVKLKINLDNKLIKNRSLIRKQPDHPNTHNRMEAIRLYEKESTEVNRLLNIQ